MKNFGVRQGAVVFRCELGALASQVTLVPDLCRRQSPDDPGATFWVLRLDPDAAAEERNRAVLHRFVSETLGR